MADASNTAIVGDSYGSTSSSSSVKDRHPLAEGPLAGDGQDDEDVPASFFPASQQGTVRASGTIRASMQGGGVSAARPGYFDLQRLAAQSDDVKQQRSNILDRQSVEGQGDAADFSPHRRTRTRSSSRAASVLSQASGSRPYTMHAGSVSGDVRSRCSGDDSGDEASDDGEDEKLPSWINHSQIRSPAPLHGNTIKPRPRAQALDLNDEGNSTGLFTPRMSVVLGHTSEAETSMHEGTDAEVSAQIKHAVEETERWKRAHDEAVSRHNREMAALRKDSEAREAALLEILTVAGISKARAERALINASAQAKVPTFRADERTAERVSRTRSPNPFGPTGSSNGALDKPRSPSVSGKPIDELRRSLSSEDKLPASIMEAMLDDFQADLQYHQARMDSSRPPSAMSVSRPHSPTPSVRSTISRATQAASSISSINGIISTLTWRKKKSKGQDTQESPSPNPSLPSALSTDAAATLTKALDRNRRRQSSSSRKASVEPNVTRLPALFSQSFIGYPVNGADETAQEGATKPASTSTRELVTMLADDVRPPTLTLAIRRGQNAMQPATLRGTVEMLADKERLGNRAGSVNGEDEYQSSGDEFEVYGGKHLSAEERAQRLTHSIQRQREAGAEDSMLTDRYGFVYDATPADVRLLRRAKNQASYAPACLTGIRVGLRARGGSGSASENESVSGEGEDDRTSSAVSEAAEDEKVQSSIKVELEQGHESTVKASMLQAGKSMHDPIPSPLATPSAPGMMDIASGRPSVSAPTLTAAAAHSAKQPGPTSPEEERAHFLSGKDAEGKAEGRIDVTEDGREAVIPRPRNVSAKRPPNTSQTVRRLLTQLQEMHSRQQEAQQAAWDRFLGKRRAFLRAKVDSASATKQSNGTAVTIDSVNPDSGPAEEQWSVGGLIGLGQLGASTRDRRELHKLVQSGVPLAYRPKVWYECSGAIERAEPGRYDELLKEHESEENTCTRQIDLDVGRTMPTNIYFAGDGPGVVKLRRLLVAYSWYNPKCGYCQGMNNLAATLLLTHATEEEAFWVLASIVENILPTDYFTSHLLVAQADQRVLIDIIRDKLPRMAKHIDQIGVDLPAVTFAWFLSLYTDCLPVETLFRVWDVILLEGMPTLFRIAVAIFSLNETDILATRSPSAFYGLMHGMTSHMFSADRLISVACDELRSSIRADKIEERRAQHMRDLSVELGLDMDSTGGVESPGASSLS